MPHALIGAAPLQPAQLPRAQCIPAAQRCAARPRTLAAAAANPLAMEDASRRMRVLGGQLGAHQPPQQPERAQLSRSSAGANASGQPSSSYARVHGEVSRAPAVWRTIDTVAREQLREVKYQKCDEGIAKVGVSLLLPACARAHCLLPWPAPHTAPHCLQITINRPEKRNAFTPRTGAARVPQRSNLGDAARAPTLPAFLMPRPQSWRCHGASMTRATTRGLASSS